MTTDPIITLSTFGFYLIFLLMIGYISERRFGKSYKGFITAEKGLGGLVSAISAAASSESAWVMLGLSGLGYSKGLAAYWAALGCVLGFVFTALFIIVRLRRSAEEVSALTVTDYIEFKLGDRSGVLRVLSSVIIVFFLMCYVVAQFIGSGKQMEGMNLMTYSEGVMVGAIVIGIYVVIGGYAAVCWTDLIQGLLMAAVMLFFPFFALIKAGGLSPVIEDITRNGDGFFIGGEALEWTAIGFIIGQLGIGLGYPGMPHSIIRYITVRNDTEARKAGIITVVWGTVVLFGSASLGIIGRVLIPGLEDSETILPAFTARYFHPIVAGIVLSAITASIMSTADSQLMVSATSLIHDLWFRLIEGGKGIFLKVMVRNTRIVIGIMAILAMLLAIPQPKVIYTFVLFAWGALGSAFSPIIILSLYWRGFNRWGALASLLLGPSTIILWKIFKLDSLLYELVPGFLVSLVSAWVVSVLTEGRRSI